MPLPFPSSHWGGFSPSALFAHGEQGVWYDPTDLSSMYQDSAGTTPVTAVEQPVGKILDKSGRGNHATQTTSTSRPVLSARVNMLTKTEAFDDAVWTLSGSTLSATKVTSPLSTQTAQQLYETATTAWHGVYRTANLTISSAMTFSCYVKANGRDYAVLNTTGPLGTDYVAACFDLVNLTATTGRSGAYTSPVATITDVGNGWRRCVLSYSTTSTSGSPAVAASNTASPTYGSFAAFAYAGDASKGIYIWGADLRATNQVVVGLPVYQRVNTSTDYDTAAFPLYLKFDGVDDSLATAAIDFTGTEKMSVFAAERKLSDSAQGVIAELSATIASNNGSFMLTAPNSASANYNFSSKGTTQVDNTVTTYTSPLSGVLTGLADISAPSNVIRVNGTQAGSSTSSQGTGNYGNYALFVGRRNSASLQWTGNLYGLIVRGALTSTPQISAAENWLRLRSRAY